MVKFLEFIGVVRSRVAVAAGRVFLGGLLQRRGDDADPGWSTAAYPGRQASIRSGHSAVPAPTEDASAVEAGGAPYATRAMRQYVMAPLAPTGAKWSEGCAQIRPTSRKFRRAQAGECIG